MVETLSASAQHKHYPFLQAHNYFLSNEGLLFKEIMVSRRWGSERHPVLIIRPDEGLKHEMPSS